MKYSADLGKLALNEYKEILRNQNLLPGRKALHLNLDANFSSISEAGIKTLEELTKALSSTQKLKALSLKTGISEDYLVLLKREAGSLQPKPISLKDFPGPDPSITEALFQIGVKTSKDFFEIYSSADEYKMVLKTLPLLESAGAELYCLCALARINGIGAAAAKCFFDAGFVSVSDIAEADAENMLSKVSGVNSENQYYKAKLGIKDMQFCIDYAKILLRVS